MQNEASGAVFSRRSSHEPTLGGASRRRRHRRTRSRVEALPWLGLSLLLGLTPFPASAQPRVTTSVTGDSVRAGQPIVLTVEVRWLGRPERYTLSPPTLTLPDSIQPRGQQQSFATVGGETRYRYRYELVPTAPGPLDLGTVTVAYRTPGDANEDSGSVEDTLPSITVLPGGARGVVATLVSGLVLVVIVVLALLWIRRRVERKRRSAESLPEKTDPSPAERLQRAQRLLTEGRIDDVYAILIELKPALPAMEDPLPPADKLEAERMRIRYGGITPSADEVRRLIRSVALVLDQQDAPG